MSDDEAYESGPFCRHWSAAGFCEACERHIDFAEAVITILGSPVADAAARMDLIERAARSARFISNPEKNQS